MDRNQIIGLVLMMGFITIYFAFFAPEPVEPVAQPATTETTTTTPAEATNTAQAVTQQLSDSARAQMNESKFGAFSVASVGIEKKIEVKNEDVRLVFNSKGAVIEEAELLKYKDWKGEPLLLVTPTTSDQHFYVDHLGKNIDLNEFYYETSQSVKADTTILSFQITVNEYAYVRYNYSIPPAGFQIGLKIETKGMNDLVGEKITYAWNHQYNRLEMDMTDARSRSTIRYNLIGNEVDYLSNRSTELQEETLDTPVKWIAFKQKFFTTAVIAEDQFKSAFVTTRVNENDTTIEKVGDFQAIVPYEKFVAGNLGMTYYFGPNDFDIMREVTPEFEENVNMGWSFLSGINKHFIRHIFTFLERFFSSFGVIIRLMVVFVRVLLAPVADKSHLSMAKMRVLKPQLDEIKEKHEGDMQAAQKEQMELYRKVGINPLSGCIPMVLQMPILFSLFYFFPNQIALRQEGFLWASDLSTYDNVLNLPFTIPFYGDHVSLFTLLMTVSTILYTWSNSQITTVTGPMKTMQYLMPIMFLFFLNSFSSGLTFYYFVSNMSTFGQTFLFKRFIDEDKIKSILEENKKKNANKKKSTFQLKLEEAMKANQEAQKKKKKK